GLNNGASSNWVNNGIVSSNNFTLTASMQSQLPQNQYYWKVRALKANQTALTDWSAPIRAFTLLDPPPNAPSLSSPANNSEYTKGSNISFTWSNVSNAVYYEIWVDNNSGFGSPEVGLNNGASSNWVNNGIVSSNNFTLTASMQSQLPQNQYYWKVRALNNAQEPITDWSSETRTLVLYNNYSNPQSWGYPCEQYNPGSYNGRTFYYDKNHLGEDILLPEGTPIYAIGDGVIKVYSSANGYGELVVVIEHRLGALYTFKNARNNDVSTNNILSIYGHLRKSKVRNGNQLNYQEGDFVTKGQLIGYVNDDANNGDGTEHLHIGIRLSDASTAISVDNNFWYRGYEGTTTFGNDFAAFSKIILQLLERTSPLELTAPSTGFEHIKGSNLSFTWTSIVDASYYEIWIDNNSGFGSPEIGFSNGASPNWLHDGIVNTNTFTLTSVMQNSLPQNSYYWKVRALDSGKNPLSDWSSSQSSFVLKNDLLEAPALSMPTDNTAFTKGNDISFTWSTVNEAIFYEIWVDNNDGFGSPEIGFSNGVSSDWINDGIVNTTSFILTPTMQNMLPQNVYFWKVRALDAEKNPLSHWSATPLSFILIDNTPCTPPTQPGIVNGELYVCMGNSYDYSIENIEGATSYIWTLPEGGLGDSESNRITVTYGASASSGLISVKGVNDCGIGEPNIINITVNPKPQQPTITLIGQTLYSDALVGNQWFNQNGIIEGAESQSISIEENGEYYVIVTLFGCSSDASNVINVNLTITNLIENSKAIKVYPNPFSNELVISSDNSGSHQIEIINTLGQIICKLNMYEKLTLQTSDFEPGIYTIRISNNSNHFYKMVLKK
ncbi:MAG: peptidoglycan DD-metalloendopeptidase family protein, partial [Paludibacter sp.]|nr:peptidoglycan DD-metalloendopeptidase family protein [Paludibacter sp.]